MENTRSIITKIGRKRFFEYSGLSKQALIRPMAEGIFPASWYLLMHNLCEEAGIECPLELFTFHQPAERYADGFLPVRHGNTNIAKAQIIKKILGPAHEKSPRK